jgi:glucose dehydrogenase
VESKKTLRNLGIFLTILGSVMVAGKIIMDAPHGSYYFFTIGVGLAISGVLLIIGKLAGVFVYLATFIVIAVWSYLEIGFNRDLTARIGLPCIIAFYLLFCDERKHLK